ncbi:lig_chan-Glu_bd domain-containing protein [Trichonephila inaurata madagascariensis]|uniref:Lig_chan-Glu_bd domain-containing protein n=1 Tax=Trichonephila inaurata madagascariensis TaxID=2747483 RepID=A0A8X6XEC9_9ARAC|nr:lig_chan-Glu_bd domain-containing protein [Trichonephila inaurata madagascariensis]
MPQKVPVPNSFEELSKAVLSGKYKCLTPIGTIDRDLLRGSGIDYMMKLREAIENNDWKYSLAENFADLLDDPAAIIAARKGLKLLLGSPPKRVNDVIHGIIGLGLYEKWLDEHAFISTLRKRLELQHEEPEFQLTLQDLKLPFFVLFGGYAFAFGALLLEVLSPKRLNIYYS